MSRKAGKTDTYEVQVRGELSDQMVKSLGGSRPINAATTIVISVEDRAALHSVIRRVEDLALELVSVTLVPSEDVK